MSGYQGPDAAAIEWRDSQECTCGHKSISHGSHTPAGPVAVGGGPCGIDRDYRAWPEWIGDPCPCEAFTTRSVRYEAARAVRDSATMGELEGALLDTFTASAMCAVYEALSETSRAKFDTIPLHKLIDLIWKRVS